MPESVIIFLNASVVSHTVIYTLTIIQEVCLQVAESADSRLTEKEQRVPSQQWKYSRS
jgi:hypothetical protein